MNSKIRIPKFNVMLTTYTDLLSDYRYLVAIRWKSIMVDEGQRLKNSDSKMFKLLMTFKSEFRVLLSGTPLQNNMTELFNLMEFINPQQFNSEFKLQLENEFQ